MSSRLSLRGLCVVLVLSLLPPPVAAEVAPESDAPEASAKKSKKDKESKKNKADKAEAAPKASAPLDPETPAAGDENIPDEPLEPGQLAPGRRTSGGGGSGPSLRISKTPNKGSDVVALELDAAASARFDEGNYAEAARLWGRGLEGLPENESNHMMRAVMLSNAVTANEQIFVETGDVDSLKRAQVLIADYLRVCKKRWGNGCERYPETVDAHKRMDEVLQRIDAAQPKIKKVPPEIDSAPGGRSFNRMVKLPPAPAWIGPTFAGGLVLIGGGMGLLYFASTDSRFKPVTTTDTALNSQIDWRSADTETTGDAGTTGDTTVDTTSTTGSTTGTAVELAPETKGDILLAFGGLAIAAGAGLIVFASIRLARHRRINRERASVLSWSPTFGPTGGGLAVSGRF